MHVLISDELGELRAVKVLEVVKILHNGSCTLAVETHTVRSHSIEVGNLLPIATLCMMFVGEIVKELLELVTILLGEFVEHTIA